jgi:2',3'-cyclic-nucleotide 2'-phosphodiesterase (5'-nucleotidase family)
MKLLFRGTLYSLCILLVGCKTTKIGQKDDGRIEVSILQINDVYEISPLENGRVGGMARVATIKKQYAAQRPTCLVHAGDFLSPSVLGTLKYNDKERVKGRQMVESMNVAGVDLVTFGNHEFDISEKEVQQRIEESSFGWVSTNVFHVVEGKRKPFTHKGLDIRPYVIKQMHDADGTSLRIGFFGVTLPSNAQNWLYYDDLIESAKRVCAIMKDSVDVVIGITHQEIDEDEEMARQMQFVPLFIGGHDHNAMSVPVGQTRITKADANAKTLYAHTLKYHHKSKKLEIISDLIPVSQAVPFDSAADVLIQRWEQFGNERFAEMGINPKERVTELTFPLDGLEQTVRGGPSALGSLCAEALSFAAPKTDFSIFNTGSIRIDDQLSGVITQYDILRILPFGGKILEVELSGRLAELAIKTGAKTNIGKGGYLALDRISYHSDTETVTFQGKPLDHSKYYRVAMPEYLMTGKESGLGFLLKGNVEIRDVVEVANPEDFRSDVRKALISVLQRR